MFLINSRTEDLIGSLLNIKTRGFDELITIHFDSETNSLVYIFSNGKMQFAKISCQAKALNISISSLFVSANFFETKLTELTSLKFNHLQSSKLHQNHSFSSFGINVDCSVKDGSISNSHVHWEQVYKSDRFISFDELFSSLSTLNYNSYQYQVMALSAFEVGLEVSHGSKVSRMVLVELDKIKYLSSRLDRFIVSSKLSELNLENMCNSFIGSNINKTNILRTDNSLFKSDFKSSYVKFKVDLSNLIEKFENTYLNKSLNKMQLRSTMHPLALRGSNVNGTLLRSSGVNHDYNNLNDILFYKQFKALRPSLDKNNSLHSFYTQIVSEINHSLETILVILNSDVLLGECYDNYSLYDLNRFNSDSCFEMENGHGLASIYLFKDSQNKIGYQIKTESLRRLYYYLENVDKIEFESQMLILEALDIKLQEIY